MKTTHAAARSAWLTCLAIAAAWLAAPAPSALAQQPNTASYVFGFGPTSGRTDVRVYAISNDGSTAVGSRVRDYYNWGYVGSALEGFRWSIASACSTPGS